MAEDIDEDPESARSRLLELLEGNNWELSKRTQSEGRIALRWLHDRAPMDCEIVDYVIGLLKEKTTLRCAPQGNPPGSTGLAWQMSDARNVFIKLRIEGGFGEKCPQEYVWIHIHMSVHPK